MWLILKRYTILEDFFLLDSVRYRDDVMMTLKFDWFNLKILMSGWYRKLTLSCVSFTTYQQCHCDNEGDVTPISLQYQNVYWGVSKLFMILPTHSGLMDSKDKLLVVSMFSRITFTLDWFWYFSMACLIVKASLSEEVLVRPSQGSEQYFQNICWKFLLIHFHLK